MDISVNYIGNDLTIKLVGELDEYTADYTRKSLDEIIGEYKINSVIFDLSNLSFMDSTGIGVLLGRYKKLKKENIPIYISNPSRSIEKLFNMSGIFSIMPKI